MHEIYLDYYLYVLLMLLTFFNIILSVYNSCDAVKLEEGKLQKLCSIICTALSYYNMMAFKELRQSIGNNEGTDRFYIIFNSALAVALVVINVLQHIQLKRRRERRIGPNSVEEAINNLPTGLCFYDAHGKVLLINNKMNEIYRHITGDGHIDMQALRRRIVARDDIGKNRYIGIDGADIVMLENGSVFGITARTLTTAAGTVNELSAHDITQLYTLSTELKQETELLARLNKRLKEYGDMVDKVVHEEEMLKARIELHDKIGKCLIATKMYLTKDEDTEFSADILNEWWSNIKVIDGVAPFESKKDEVNELKEAAKFIGIELKITGKPPREKQALRLFMQGARESLTNAVKHAKATVLYIDITRTDREYIIEYHNNGIRPEERIKEGGGLTSLRKSADSIHAVMRIDNEPEFKLVLIIPCKEVTNDKSINSRR